MNRIVKSSNIESFDLSGQWMVTNDSDKMYQVYFDFIPNDQEKYELFVQGEKAQLQTFKKSHGQYIFTFKQEGNSTQSVLVSVLDHGKIKFSQVDDSINEFQPVGKLGEKVYHLQKVNPENQKLVVQNKPD